MEGKYKTRLPGIRGMLDLCYFSSQSYFNQYSHIILILRFRHTYILFGYDVALCYIHIAKCINLMSYSVTLNIEKAASAKIYTCIEVGYS